MKTRSLLVTVLVVFLLSALYIAWAHWQQARDLHLAQQIIASSPKWSHITLRPSVRWLLWIEGTVQSEQDLLDLQHQLKQAGTCRTVLTVKIHPNPH
jgi:hypothetical protein